MKYFCALLSLLPFAFYTQQTLNKTITHDGGTREYIIHIPGSYDGSSDVPLLFCFHGYTSSANTIMSYSKFNTISNNNGFIVVYPQGTLLDGNTHWNVGGWTLNSTTDDVGFTDALLDTLINDYSIDIKKVYSTGMSNGGYMSFLLACQLSDRFAAIASVTGSMTIQTYNACSPTHPMPVMQIHGTADGTVPYNGSSSWTKSISSVLTYWTTNNNCNTSPTNTLIENTNTSDGSTVEHIVYSNCTNCARVEHYKVIGGDHDWPGVWGNMDINASNLVWEFLSKYDINGLIDCGTLATPDNTNTTTLSVNYSGNSLQILGLNNQSTAFRVYSVNGRLVQEGELSNTNNLLDISNYTQGIYVISIDAKTLKFIKK